MYPNMFKTEYMKKEIPILFSTAMVQAILNGNKTVTRRVVKGGFDPNHYEFAHIYEHENPKLGHQAYFKDNNTNSHWGIKLKWLPGDVLWVRESWNETDPDELAPGEYVGAPCGFVGCKGDKPIHWHYVYKASSPGVHPEHGKARWKPSIHMPKAAARIWLEVVSVRVERLKDISEEQAKAEGIGRAEIAKGRMVYKDYTEGKQHHPDDINDWFSVPQNSFCSLWKQINGAESWDANPWVWVVEFKVLSTTGKPEILTCATH